MSLSIYETGNETGNEISNGYFERSLKVSPGGVHSPVRAFKSVDGKPIFSKVPQVLI